jgi:hypothetical protein
MGVVILLMLARPPAVNAEALFDGPCGGVWLNLIAATGGFDQRRVKFTYSLKGVQLGSAKSWADVPFVGIDFERPFASHMFWRATAISSVRPANLRHWSRSQTTGWTMIEGHWSTQLKQSWSKRSMC